MDEVEIRQERAHGERHYDKDAYEVITYSLKNIFGILKLKVTTFKNLQRVLRMCLVSSNMHKNVIR